MKTPNYVFKRRLLKLSNFLAKLNKKHFNLEDWVTSDENYDINQKAINHLCALAKGKTKKCGTTACAFGWTPAVFPHYLRWDLDDIIVVKDKKLKKAAYNYQKGRDIYDDYSKSLIFDSIAHEFFGLDYADFEYLFMPDSYPEDHRGPKSVAKRIKSFAEKKFVKE